MFLMYFARASHNSNNRDVLVDLFEQTKKNSPLNPLRALYLTINRCVINDENNKGYVVVQAVESLFRIIDRGITD